MAVAVRIADTAAALLKSIDLETRGPQRPEKSAPGTQ
jgi:hypothetical protein